MNWKYFAGFIDGEGCIHFNKANETYMITFSQAGNNRIVMPILKKFLDEHFIRVTMRDFIPKNPKHSPAIFATIYGARNVRKTLAYLLPHLIVKKEAAIEAMKRCNELLLPRDEKMKFLREARKEYIDGIPISQLTKKYKMATKTLQDFFIRSGVTLRLNKGKGFTQEQRLQKFTDRADNRLPMIRK